MQIQRLPVRQLMFHFIQDAAWLTVPRFPYPHPLPLALSGLLEAWSKAARPQISRESQLWNYVSGADTAYHSWYAGMPCFLSPVSPHLSVWSDRETDTCTPGLECQQVEMPLWPRFQLIVRDVHSFAAVWLWNSLSQARVYQTLSISIITGLLLCSTWWLESTCGMRWRAQRLNNNNEWQHLTRYVKGHDCFAPIWPQFWGTCSIAAASLLHEHTFQPCAIRDHARIASHVWFLSGVVVLVCRYLSTEPSKHKMAESIPCAMQLCEIVLSKGLRWRRNVDCGHRICPGTGWLRHSLEVLTSAPSPISLSQPCEPCWKDRNSYWAGCEAYTTFARCKLYVCNQPSTSACEAASVEQVHLRGPSASVALGKQDEGNK